MMTPRVLAPYLLRLLASAQQRGRPLTLQDLVDSLEVRRADLRSALTALAQQGLVDILTLRLTLEGFALGSALRTRKLPPIPRQVAEGKSKRIVAA
jgi:DNA-binding IclR family transcriptional regulator